MRNSVKLPLIADIESAKDLVKDFVTDTAADFVVVWEDRPNVLIWCTIAGILLLWI